MPMFHRVLIGICPNGKDKSRYCPHIWSLVELVDLLLSAGVEKMYGLLHSLQIPCRCFCGIARTLTWYFVFFLRWVSSIFITILSNDEMFWIYVQTLWEIRWIPFAGPCTKWSDRDHFVLPCCGSRSRLAAGKVVSLLSGNLYSQECEHRWQPGKAPGERWRSTPEDFWVWLRGNDNHRPTKRWWWESS